MKKALHPRGIPGMDVLTVLMVGDLVRLHMLAELMLMTGVLEAVIDTT
jgi:hypothetical protein